MCECLTYDDGEMHLCRVCADAWREEERLRALFTPERMVKPDADSLSQFEPYYRIPAVMVDREEREVLF